MANAGSQKQVNLRVQSALYQALESIAREERRTVPQAARILLEEALCHRSGLGIARDDTPSTDMAVLALVGGSFDWLSDEPDLYDDTCGEPV